MNRFEYPLKKYFYAKINIFLSQWGRTEQLVCLGYGEPARLCLLHLQATKEEIIRISPLKFNSRFPQVHSFEKKYFFPISRPE